MTIELDKWHFSRPNLANKYLDLFKIGLTSARGLFARRRMGKTEFLKKDLIPAAEADGYIGVYVNLWNLETDPETVIISEFYKALEPKGFNKLLHNLSHPINKVKATGKIPGIGEGAVEAEFPGNDHVAGTLLMTAMSAFDKTKYQLILVIDEAQVLAYSENSKFAHSLRAILDIRKDRIKVIFAGSSEATLRRMFGVASEPFYNWAPLEPFDLLGEEFIKAMVDRVNKICSYPLNLTDAMNAFVSLKNTPEFFRRYIEHYIQNPDKGSDIALQNTISNVFNDSTFKKQWDNLLAADKVILSLIAQGVENLHSKQALIHLGNKLGIEDNVNKNTPYNAIQRLLDKNMLTKMDYGQYQFEDESFADWVREQEDAEL